VQNRYFKEEGVIEGWQDMFSAS